VRAARRLARQARGELRSHPSDLLAMRRISAPFEMGAMCPLSKPIKRADTTWVEPLSDIAYTEITGESMLRHPSFKGLGEVREEPVSRMCMDVFS
jgi:hypothetical protein